MRLDRVAFDLLFRFFVQRPDIYLYEAHDHGVDPLQFPDLYMESELMEPEHLQVLGFVEHNRGVITGPMIEQWIREEVAEQEHLE